MSAFKEKIKSAASRKVWVPQLVCACFAVILWGYVSSHQSGEMTVRVPIEFQNLSNTLIVADVEKHSVAVKLNGNLEEIHGFNPKSLKASVDLSNPIVGDLGNYPVELAKQDIPENVTVSLSDKKIFIKVEKKVSKKVRVIPVLEQPVHEGTFVGNIRVVPETVTVWGPESIMANFDAVETKPITLSRETGRVVRYTQINTSSYKNVEVELSSVNVVIPVFSDEHILKMSVPVTHLGVRDTNSYEFEYNDVSLYFSIDAAPVVIPPDAVEAVIDLAQPIVRSSAANLDEYSILECAVTVHLKKPIPGCTLTATVPDRIFVKMRKNK